MVLTSHLVCQCMRRLTGSGKQAKGMQPFVLRAVFSFFLQQLAATREDGMCTYSVC